MTEGSGAVPVDVDAIRADAQLAATGSAHTFDDVFQAAKRTSRNVEALIAALSVAVQRADEAEAKRDELRAYITRWEAETEEIRDAHEVAEAAIQRVRDLHRKTRWTGWKRYAAMASHNPTAFLDDFCSTCQQDWPCPTAAALSGPVQSETDTR